MNEQKRKLFLRIMCGIIASVFVVSIVGSIILQVVMM